MIKTAIIGAGTPDGGELIRLLSMHPDVEITAVNAKGLEGTKITDRHHGLIGDIDLNFSDKIDFEKCDVLFVSSPEISDAEIVGLRNAFPELKIILFHVPVHLDREKYDIVYGVPEIFRKAFVRGAMAAEVPESFAVMALVALFPFASHLLLNSDINIDIKAPESIIKESDPATVKEEIIKILQFVQKSFVSEISMEVTAGDMRRSSLMDITFDCTLNLPQIMELYDIYDDHNFTFVTTSPIGVSEVAGTDKCIISVSKPAEDKVRLTVAADCRLRGASGDAVHIMNLMFGLHEKTGLALKASDFERIGDVH